MALTAKGLIIREHHVGEADRFVTVLTDEYGVIRASVRGARRVNSRSGAATRLLSYARLSLIQGRDKYIVETAVPERVFFALGGSVEQLALAQYFCELVGVLAPSDEAAHAYLQLILNALHLLEQGKEPDGVKAVAELRLLALSGYLPDLHTCRCKQGQPPLWFHPITGELGCAVCYREGSIPLSSSVYDAMRHVLYGDPSKAFSFRLPPKDLLDLADVAERFLIGQLSRRFQTLDFYHGLSADPIV